MLDIRNSADLARAFEGPLDPALRDLLVLRRDQLLAYGDTELGNLAHFIVVQAKDSLGDVEAEAGFPLTGDDVPFEFVERHASGWLEAVIIVSDDGFGVVVLARDCITTDPALLLSLRAHA